MNKKEEHNCKETVLAKPEDFHSISETVGRILTEASKADELGAEFQTSLLERYKRFLIRFSSRYKTGQSNRLRLYLWSIQVLFGVLGGGLGFFLIYFGFEDKVKLVVWIAYMILVVVVAITVKLIPDDITNFSLEAEKLRLLNLSERLAAELVLFDLIEKEQIITGDDKQIIKKISEKVPPLESLEEEIKSKIRACQDTAKVFSSSRETNVSIKELELDQEIAARLQDATRQIVELCGHIFAGRDYTAKIYLRCIKDFEESKVEILTSFAKYPSSAQNPYGSSWVKARGNPSIVWDCLEKGQSVHKTDKGLSPYYTAVLAICLPGRIGVLALTSSSENAFKDKDDEWAVRALAVATRALVLRALKIEVV